MQPASQYLQPTSSQPKQMRVQQQQARQTTPASANSASHSNTQRGGGSGGGGDDDSDGDGGGGDEDDYDDGGDDDGQERSANGPPRKKKRRLTEEQIHALGLARDLRGITGKKVHMAQRIQVAAEIKLPESAVRNWLNNHKRKRGGGGGGGPPGGSSGSSSNVTPRHSMQHSTHHSHHQQQQSQQPQYGYHSQVVYHDPNGMPVSHQHHGPPPPPQQQAQTGNSLTNFFLSPGYASPQSGVVYMNPPSPAPNYALSPAVDGQAQQYIMTGAPDSDWSHSHILSHSSNALAVAQHAQNGAAYDSIPMLQMRLAQQAGMAMDETDPTAVPTHPSYLMTPPLSTTQSPQFQSIGPSLGDELHSKLMGMTKYPSGNSLASLGGPLLSEKTPLNDVQPSDGMLRSARIPAPPPSSRAQQHIPTTSSHHSSGVPTATGGPPNATTNFENLRAQIRSLQAKLTETFERHHHAAQNGGIHSGTTIPISAHHPLPPTSPHPESTSINGELLALKANGGGGISEEKIGDLTTQSRSSTSIIPTPQTFARIPNTAITSTNVGAPILPTVTIVKEVAPAGTIMPTFPRQQPLSNGNPSSSLPQTQQLMPQLPPMAQTPQAATTPQYESHFLNSTPTPFTPLGGGAYPPSPATHPLMLQSGSSMASPSLAPSGSVGHAASLNGGSGSQQDFLYDKSLLDAYYLADQGDMFTNSASSSSAMMSTSSSNTNLAAMANSTPITTAD